MTSSASKLIVDGIDGARIAFGPDKDPIPSAQLADTGSSYFSEGAAPTVGILMTNDQPTVEVLLGAIVTGTPVVSLPPPTRGVNLAAYANFLSDSCRSQGVEEVIADDRIAALMAETDLDISVRSHSKLRSGKLAQPADHGFQLVQFSSGSTAQPKAILFNDATLGANIAAILAALRPQPGDVAVSWLPLAHDMGLVGMLLASIAAMSPPWAKAGPIVLLDPARFLRRPSLWLEAIDHWHGTFTAAPDFGYQMVTRRSTSAPLDLSGLRCAIVGGEVTRVETLTAFAARYEDSGFNSLALCPAYGMAELGLAASMTSPDEPWCSRTISTTALADGSIRPARTDEPETVVVASGRAVPGYRICCDTDSDRVGQIAVNGPSIGTDGRTRRSLADADGWYQTGDAGFLDDGLLYVCGRTDDYIVAHGRNIYAPVVENAVSALVGVRTGRVAVVGLPNGDWAVVAEPAARGRSTTISHDTLRREVARAAVQITTAQPDEIIFIPRGSLPITGSGKLRRNEVRRRLLNRSLITLGRR